MPWMMQDEVRRVANAAPTAVIRKAILAKPSRARREEASGGPR